MTGGLLCFVLFGVQDPYDDAKTRALLDSLSKDIARAEGLDADRGSGRRYGGGGSAAGAAAGDGGGRSGDSADYRRHGDGRSASGSETGSYTEDGSEWSGEEEEWDEEVREGGMAAWLPGWLGACLRPFVLFVCDGWLGFVCFCSTIPKKTANRTTPMALGCVIARMHASFDSLVTSVGVHLCVFVCHVVVMVTAVGVHCRRPVRRGCAGGAACCGAAEPPFACGSVADPSRHRRSTQSRQKDEVCRCATSLALLFLAQPSHLLFYVLFVDVGSEWDALVHRLNDSSRRKQMYLMRAQQRAIATELSGLSFKPRICKRSQRLAADQKALAERTAQLMSRREKNMLRVKDERAQAVRGWGGVPSGVPKPLSVLLCVWLFRSSTTPRSSLT